MEFYSSYRCDECIKKSVCRYAEEVETIKQNFEKECSEIDNPVLRLTFSCREEKRKK